MLGRYAGFYFVWEEKKKLFFVSVSVCVQCVCTVKKKKFNWVYGQIKKKKKFSLSVRSNKKKSFHQRDFPTTWKFLFTWW